MNNKTYLINKICKINNNINFRIKMIIRNNILLLVFRMIIVKIKNYNKVHILINKFKIYSKNNYNNNNFSSNNSTNNNINNNSNNSIKTKILNKLILINL